jgi:chromosome segregation ATPase
MRQLNKANAIDEELKDLKLRFELLGNDVAFILEGDRKAYYETSQWAIRRNKEEMNALRVTNKELRDSVSRLKKHDTSFSSHSLSMTPIEKLDQRICEIHKKYDDLQLEARSKESKLKSLKDQLDELKKDGDTVKANIQDSPFAKVNGHD